MYLSNTQCLGTNSFKETGRPFFEVLRRLPGSSAVVIGDSINDKIGAEKAKMSFVRIQKANSFLKQRKYLRRAILEAVKILTYEFNVPI